MAAATKTSTAVALYRGLLREVRQANGQDKGIMESKPLLNFVRAQFKKHRTTDEQYCKAREEMAHLADTYETYLRSQRNWFHFHQEYHAKGERSVAETAKIVGFKLPHDPK
jgi:phage-related minor tail protein